MQLAMAAGDGRLEFLAGRKILPAYGPLVGIDADKRHLHDHAGARMDRQEWRIGRGALLAQRGLHDFLDRLEAPEHKAERRVEAARLVKSGRRSEFVIVAEAVEQLA